MRIIAVALAALVLAGCQTTAPRTAEAECRIFEGPPHVVEAVTRSGQLWVDETISIGIRVCGWPRPGAVKLAPSAAASSVDACPYDMAAAVAEDRRAVARSLRQLRGASERHLARLRAEHGVSRPQFDACVADAEAALR